MKMGASNIIRKSLMAKFNMKLFAGVLTLGHLKMFEEKEVH
jgi:hypothetical protein